MTYVKKIPTLAFFIIVFASQVYATPITITFNPSLSGDGLKLKTSSYFKRLVEQRSGHRIKVELINEAQQLTTQQLLASTEKGEILMAAPEITEFYTLNPRLQMFSWPFLFASKEQLYRMIDGPIGNKLLEDTSRDGFVALSFWDQGFTHFTANRPLNQIQQRSLFTLGISHPGATEDQFKGTMIKPKTVTAEVAYNLLQENLIEGYEDTLANIYRRNLYQIQPELILSNHGYRGFIIIVNQPFWAELPEDLKVITAGAMKDAADYTRELALQIENNTLAKIRSSNQLQIVTLTTKERETWQHKFRDNFSKLYPLISGNLWPGQKVKKIR